MSSNSPTQSTNDPNAMLIQLCVKALSAVAPEGMTTKDLAAALDKEVKGTPGFDGISSSILSSKLNAIFRRCHGDSATPSRSQLAELPLTRSQSSEVPRRLVYRYTPPGASVPKPSVVPTTPTMPATPAEDSSSGDESTELNEPLTPKEDTLVEKHSYGSAAKKRRVSGHTVKEVRYPAEPGTPPESFSETRSESAAVRNKEDVVSSGHVPSKHPEDFATQLGKSKEESQFKPLLKRPRIAIGKPMGLNLYYDAVGLDAMSAALNLKARRAEDKQAEDKQAEVSTDNDTSGELDWSDFPSPELLGLHELDGFLC